MHCNFFFLNHSFFSNILTHLYKLYKYLYKYLYLYICINLFLSIITLSKKYKKALEKYSVPSKIINICKVVSISQLLSLILQFILFLHKLKKLI